MIVFEGKCWSTKNTMPKTLVLTSLTVLWHIAFFLQCFSSFILSLPVLLLNQESIDAWLGSFMLLWFFLEELKHSYNFHHLKNCELSPMRICILLSLNTLNLVMGREGWPCYDAISWMPHWIARIRLALFLTVICLLACYRSLCCKAGQDPRHPTPPPRCTSALSSHGHWQTRKCQTF